MRLNRPNLFEIGWGVDPFRRPAVKYDVLQQVSAQALGLLRPLRRARRNRRPRDAAQDERFHLQQSGTGSEYILPQNGLKLFRGALRESFNRKQNPSEERKNNHVDVMA